MVEWRNGGKGLTNWSGSCMIFVCLYEVNNTKNPSKKGMETDMSERKQAPETPWYLRPFGPLVSLALLCVVWESTERPGCPGAGPGPSGPGRW